METKCSIQELRLKLGMSQEELAEKVFVTRQAVSRWETGETVPNTETLKLLSKLFDVSINALLGDPQVKVCQRCGMPMEDGAGEEALDDGCCTWCHGAEDFCKTYPQIGGPKQFELFKQTLIHEFNTLLHVEGLPEVKELHVLPGHFVNMEYRLPSGEKVKFLDDSATYLGNQLECLFGGDRCFGIVAGLDFLLVCTYEENGENPELVVYKHR